MKQLMTVMFVLFALPASAQEALSPLQQYLYNESGYAPPMAPVPAPVQAPATVAVADPYYQPYPPQTTYEAPDGYYEDTGSEVGPSSDSPSLRALMTSSGF